MASFKMEDLQKSVYGHAFNAHELPLKKAEGSKAMVGRRDKRPLVESEVLIKTFILEAETPVTMLQICDHIGRKPSPQFRAVVDEMVKRGEVAKAADTAMAGNLPKYWYWRPE